MSRGVLHQLLIVRRVLVTLALFGAGFATRACLPVPIKPPPPNTVVMYNAVGQRVPTRIITTESGSYQLTVRSADVLIYRKDTDFLKWSR